MKFKKIFGKDGKLPPRWLNKTIITLSTLPSYKDLIGQNRHKTSSFFLELVNPKYTPCIFNQHYVNTARRNLTASHRQRCTVPRQCGKMGAICMIWHVKRCKQIKILHFKIVKKLVVILKFGQRIGNLLR